MPPVKKINSAFITIRIVSLWQSYTTPEHLSKISFLNYFHLLQFKIRYRENIASHDLCD